MNSLDFFAPKTRCGPKSGDGIASHFVVVEPNPLCCFRGTLYSINVQEKCKGNRRISKSQCVLFLLRFAPSFDSWSPVDDGEQLNAIDSNVLMHTVKGQKTKCYSL